MENIDIPLTVTTGTPGRWDVTFNNGPLNLLDARVFAALRVLVRDAATAERLRVITFQSANPDYFIAHLDGDTIFDVPDLPGAAAMAAEWHRFVDDFKNLPVLTVAVVRGRARGIGSEFALACDVRFASTEKAVFAQGEIGFGVVPGAGAIEWLPGLVGRSRALEILIGGDDFDAATAERYGWVNRALPDAELDPFVQRFTDRVTSWDRDALATMKRLVDRKALTADSDDILESFGEIVRLSGTPSAQARMTAMVNKGFNTESDAERNFPAYTPLLRAELGSQLDDNQSPDTAGHE
jgi:enoyl-CoA hydratase/carnithine racemase